MTALLVFAGGGVGALLRYGLGRLVASGGGAPHAATLTVNIVGCLAMGLLAGLLAGRGAAADPWRLLLATGLLGGFTTFSAFGLETVTLWQRGSTIAALVYVAASVALSIAAVAFGLMLARAG